jgi:hypothetical protein
MTIDNSGKDIAMSTIMRHILQEFSVSTINNSFSYTNSFHANKTNMENYASNSGNILPTEVKSAPKNTLTDTVEISKEGREKQLASPEYNNNNNNNEVEENTTLKTGGTSNSAFAGMLEELQEKLKKLLEEISRLKAQGDEESLQRARALAAEAASINEQISKLTMPSSEVD